MKRLFLLIPLLSLLTLSGFAKPLEQVCYGNDIITRGVDEGKYYVSWVKKDTNTTAFTVFVYSTSPELDDEKASLGVYRTFWANRAFNGKFDEKEALALLKEQSKNGHKLKWIKKHTYKFTRARGKMDLFRKEK